MLIFTCLWFLFLLKVYIQPGADEESFFQFQPTFSPEDFDIDSPLQLPVSNIQGSSFIDPVFPYSNNNELNLTQLQSDRDDEQEEYDTQFSNSLLVDPDENSQEEIRHFRDIRSPESLQKVYIVDGGPSSDTDTDTAQARVISNYWWTTNLISIGEYYQYHWSSMHGILVNVFGDISYSFLFDIMMK